jgi:phospholipid/cholesterol/gamma-HCH transport system permease protein
VTDLPSDVSIVTPPTLVIAGRTLRCAGAWTLDGADRLEPLLRAAAAAPGVAVLDASGITRLDTAGALLLLQIAADRGAGAPAWEGLAPEDQALLDLVRERLAAGGERPAPAPRASFVARLGEHSWAHVEQAIGFLGFLGEAAVAAARLIRNPRRLRWKALLTAIEDAGADAVPIVGLLSFLIGVVVAYQGGQLLKTYGANIFIVEMVTLTMVREMAPLIVAIIVAGRTGSAYTAQIGTMQVTEEVDALRTIGIHPMDLLVLPKLMALLIALPLLTLFADALGVFGGMLVAWSLLDLNLVAFAERIPAVLSWRSLLVGVGKAPLFALIIALVGCFQGFQVRGGADSVGRQTTVSVVQSIFLVIIVDAILVVNFGSWGLR